MKHLFTILLLIGVASATELSGHLYDALTNEPVPDARIKMGMTSTTSDDDGLFSIAYTPNTQLEVTARGYAPYLWAKPVVEGEPLDIAMLADTDSSSKPYANFFARLIDFAGMTDLHEQGIAIWRGWINRPLPVALAIPDASDELQEAFVGTLEDWEMALGRKLFLVVKPEEVKDYGIIIYKSNPALMEDASHPRIEYQAGNNWYNSHPASSPRGLTRITLIDNNGYYDPQNAMTWAIGRALVGGAADPKLFNPRTSKSILHLPFSSLENEGNLTATVRNVSPDDARCMALLLSLPDNTNLSRYYYRSPEESRRDISEGLHGFFGMGIGAGYFAEDHWRQVWKQKTGETYPTAVMFPARMLTGLALWRARLTGEAIGASPLGEHDSETISGKPNHAHFSALYCAKADLSFSVSPWREYVDLKPHGGYGYLAYELGGYSKWIEAENAKPFRSSSPTYGAGLTISPLGARYKVARGFCIPLPPDLDVDYTIFSDIDRTSILSFKLGSLVYPTRASGFPPTELYLFFDRYTNQGSVAHLMGFQFTTYLTSSGPAPGGGPGGEGRP